VYIIQSQGYEILGQENLVCKLNKSLYGLPQSPRMWYKRNDSYLRSIGMTHSTSDNNLYYIGTCIDKVILVLYIDDIFVTGGDDSSKISWLKSILKKEFDMADLGLVQCYLEVEFTTLDTGIFLSQHQYALLKFNMIDFQLEHIPLSQGLQCLNHDKHIWTPFNTSYVIYTK
jgi:hypothetical protein